MTSVNAHAANSQTYSVKYNDSYTKSTYIHNIGGRQAQNIVPSSLISIRQHTHRRSFSATLQIASRMLHSDMTAAREGTFQVVQQVLS